MAPTKNAGERSIQATDEIEGFNTSQPGIALEDDARNTLHILICSAIVVRKPQKSALPSNQAIFSGHFCHDAPQTPWFNHFFSDGNAAFPVFQLHCPTTSDDRQEDFKVAPPDMDLESPLEAW